jgi:glycosyltransferase involved in cell wall biosynthesis
MMSLQNKGNDKAGLADPAWDGARRQVGSGLLSVVMPAFNLGRVISANVKEVYATFCGQIPFELVVVDDGSTDDTKQELQKLSAEMPVLRTISLGRNMGKGAALKQGFEASRGNYVLLLDADLDLPPKQVSTFFDIMEREKADVVIGSKRHPDSRLDYPWYRRLMSGMYYALVKLLVQLPVKDTQTGIKLFKRETLDWAFPRMLVKQFAFDLEMLAIIHEKGYKIAESPVSLQFQGRLGCFRPQTVRQIMNDTLAVFYRLRLIHYYQTLRDMHMPVPPPLVSIVIAFPAPTPYLEEALHGIQRQTYENHEVLLLPNEPTGKVWPEGVREIPTGRIRPAEKRNIGIQQAGGSIVAFLDDDTFPVDNWLKQAVVYFSDDAIAAVGGPASTPANDPWLAMLGGRVYENPFVSGNYRYRYEPGRVKEVDDYPSCNLFVRTEVLRKIGGFRADFWPGEDTYLCLEIVQNLHRKIIYDPRVQVYHHRRKLFLPHLRQIGRYALHRGYFAKKFPSTSRKLSYMIPSLFVAGVVVGAVVSVCCPLCRLLYISALLLYAALTLMSSVSLNPLTWLLTWIGIVLTHAVYGVRFILGFMSSRMPGDVRRFDHLSENVGARNKKVNR